ncbi:fimbria/pilus periplasmic chaperone [Paraburkholderia dioscoreae]|uniref:Periplasmic pilin chaperone n=1 Tax=Paraburkholderia dioscoreae TaxID=2604047 RepID=A0A5Q4ZCB3_9BURK|nr:fimbria/pilus periplasmic chaperone [Paraburkholderia dioscoreae]VVD29911.1 periplasmic pilin chaperone [Paraburkholderia dioscoreae]
MSQWISKVFAMLALGAIVLGSTAEASVVITGTRVVFPGDSREVTVKLFNDGKAPALVQTWMDTGDEKAAPESIQVPFVLTPSMFRLDPDKGQTLRMVYAGEPLPRDKESLFWLNVLEVPPKASGEDAANRIQLAFRSRIKVMYRPGGLPGTAEEAPRQLTWEIARRDGAEGYELTASNPSSYVVNLGSVELEVAGRKYEIEPKYVLAKGVARFPVPGLSSVASNGTTVTYSSIDDWGVIRPATPSQVANGSTQR